MTMKLPKGTRLAIRQALEKTHSASEINAILTRTQRLYYSFIREAPAPGGMNILRPQYYGGLSVFAFYEAMDRKVENDVLQEVLWRMLLGGGDIRKMRPIRLHFSGTRLQGAGLWDPSEVRRLRKQTGRKRTMEKHVEIRGQPREPRERDQHAADELPGSGFCEKALL